MDRLSVSRTVRAYLFSGTSGVTPTSNSGTLFEWIPAKSAFRAGAVSGIDWNDGYIGEYSTAFGYNTIADGEYAFASGYGTYASGEASTAMGYADTANNEFSTAFGFFTSASGYSATAMGYRSTASNYWTEAIGYYAEANGETSTAIGTFATANGYGSSAFGYDTYADGNYSTALGVYTTAGAGATDTAATALGYGTTASGKYTTAMGSNASTNSKNGAFVYGDYSTSTVMNATAANQFDVRAAGGVNFYTKSDLSTGVSFPANGGITSGISGTSGSTGSISLGDASSSHPYTTSFSAGSQSANVNYTLPTAAPSSSGQMLASTTAGVMSWATGLHLHQWCRVQCFIGANNCSGHCRYTILRREYIRE